MRLDRATIVLVMVVLGVWGLSMSRSLSAPAEREGDRDTNEATSLSVDPAVKPSEPQPSPPKAPPAPKTSHIPGGVLVPPIHPFEYQVELDLFTVLRRKVLLSEQDKNERNRLVHDQRLIRALGLRLTEASVAPSVLQSQNHAVDLLVEALKTGDQALASEVLRAVVEDPQVENSQLDPSVRQNLAGIKAEVLLHWTALVPDAASQIQHSLPGPVSQRIWANVQHRQASNDAESALEAPKGQ